VHYEAEARVRCIVEIAQLGKTISRWEVYSIKSEL